MTDLGLSDRELELIRGVLRRHREVREAKLFGSRAKGVARINSDVDLALWGELSPLLEARIQGELDELPTPYTYDVQRYDAILHDALREHIDRAGRTIYVRDESRQPGE
ncbi:MAG: nucleotidyltransferase domain-containing protein [Candidatus Eisenbacteria bacterium]